MSDMLSTEAPETVAAAPEVSETAPVGETAAEVGSVTGAETKYVEAKRFDGLMAAHQRTLAELAELRAALDTRNSQETTEVADDDVREEISALRADLMSERLEAAKLRALDKFPAAKPLADLIVGSTVSEIETVTRAIAERLETLSPAPQEPTPEPETEPVVETPPTQEVPVVAGGTTPPATPSTADAVQEALKAGDWSAYWQAKSGVSASNVG